MGIIKFWYNIAFRGSYLLNGPYNLCFGFASLRKVSVFKKYPFLSQFLKKRVKFWSHDFCIKEKALNEKKAGSSISSEKNNKYKKVLTLDRVEGTVEHGEDGLYVFSCECNICKNRILKKFSKKAYNEGVVIIRCDKCKNLHLISDRLGWFTDC
ncbi:hypothetical protein FG379_002625 [Cryptosporidium bovis]|uniref:uncharacterized protein n=1 Tax=Cryptosporidium bovis TaxID=310047 RepID=UPI00351A95A0|nr:hypothetical protein FG379_002625 [Cryptosporidium bovis]